MYGICMPACASEESVIIVFITLQNQSVPSQMTIKSEVLENHKFIVIFLVTQNLALVVCLCLSK
jgi:hypothetical protein